MYTFKVNETHALKKICNPGEEYVCFLTTFYIDNVKLQCQAMTVQHCSLQTL